MSSVAIRSNVWITDFARIRVHVNEVKTGKQVTGERRVSSVNACIQHGDTDRLSIGSGSAIY